MTQEEKVLQEENTTEETINQQDTNKDIADDSQNATLEELAKEKDKFLRLFAEFENYKKRTSKERIELFKTAGQDVIQSLLPVLDDFDRALIEIAKTEDKNLLKGVELIYNKLINTLKTKGLEQVEVAVSEHFDSEIHEAVTQIPAPDQELKGKVIDVVEKGYKLGDKIIRFPKVVVGQ